MIMKRIKIIEEYVRVLKLKCMTQTELAGPSRLWQAKQKKLWPGRVQLRLVS